MHWLPRTLVLRNDSVWRCNLLGGGRVLSLVDRLKRYRTLKELAVESRWEFGEGWIFGNVSDGQPAGHVVGKPYVEADELYNAELDSLSFSLVPNRPIQRPRHQKIYTPPILLIHKHEDLPFGTWSRSYLTYRHTILGISAASGDQENLIKVATCSNLRSECCKQLSLCQETAAFASKATAVLSGDILQLPFPENWISISRPTSESSSPISWITTAIFFALVKTLRQMMMPGLLRCPNSMDVFTSRISAVYKKTNYVH